MGVCLCIGLLEISCRTFTHYLYGIFWGPYENRSELLHQYVPESAASDRKAETGVTARDLHLRWRARDGKTGGNHARVACGLSRVRRRRTLHEPAGAVPRIRREI